MNWIQSVITHSATHWGILLLFGLSSFFPWYFLQHPEELPFSFAAFTLISQIMIVFISIPLWWGGYQLGGYSLIWRVGILGVYAMAMEIFAIHTGWIYSDFTYGDMIGHGVAGVPWTVAFSWLPLFTLALGVVLYIKRWQYRILWGTIILVWCDIVLDPAATELGFWSWKISEGFYNVPWHNFAGWILSSAGAFSIWELLKPSSELSHKTGRKIFMFSGLLSVIFWTVMNTWLGFWIPALAGVILLMVCYIAGYTFSVGVRTS